MKKLFGTLLVALMLMMAFSTTADAQIVYTYPTTTLTTTTSGSSAYMTYPSELKLNYVAYMVFKVDTTAYVDSMLVVHQAQISIDNSTWFDYGDPDTLIKYSDVAEKSEDYILTDTPFKYWRDKFTQNDSCTSVITGSIMFKRKY